MAQSELGSKIIPLRRLLERRETLTLLEKFQTLIPGLTLTVIGANGHLFASTGEWTANPSDFTELLLHADDDQIIYTADLLLQPLLIKSQSESQLVGAVVMHALQRSPGQIPTPETVLRCIHHSLVMVLAHALEKRDIAHETLERYREINLLYHISETIGTRLNPEEILELVLSEADRVIRTDVGIVLLPVAEDKTVLEVKASFGAANYAETLHQTAQPLITQVLQRGRPDILTFSPVDSGPISTILCAPLRVQEKVLGVMLLGRLERQSMFTAGDEKLLMALATQAAIAIEKAWLHQQEIKRQRLEEELSIGRRIQLSLLPENSPNLPGWEFAAIYQSARQVGGDFYDFLELSGPPRRLGMVIADVTGKGVPAALFMAFSRSIMSAESISGHNPAAALERVNRLIVKNSRSKLFLSIFYAILNIDDGRLAYASGGHNWPLWLRVGTGQIEELEARGFVLGAFEDIVLEEREVNVAPNDLLVFCTDGVIEAMNAKGQMFGEARLRATVMANTGASAKQLLQAIVEATQSFTGDTLQSDDFTLFVVKRKN